MSNGFEIVDVFLNKLKDFMRVLKNTKQLVSFTLADICRYSSIASRLIFIMSFSSKLTTDLSCCTFPSYDDKIVTYSVDVIGGNAFDNCELCFIK